MPTLTRDEMEIAKNLGLDADLLDKLEDYVVDTHDDNPPIATINCTPRPQNVCACHSTAGFTHCTYTLQLTVPKGCIGYKPIHEAPHELCQHHVRGVNDDFEKARDEEVCLCVYLYLYVTNYYF